MTLRSLSQQLTSHPISEAGARTIREKQQEEQPRGRRRRRQEEGTQAPPTLLSSQYSSYSPSPSPQQQQVACTSRRRGEILGCHPPHLLHWRQQHRHHFVLLLLVVWPVLLSRCCLAFCPPPSITIKIRQAASASPPSGPALAMMMATSSSSTAGPAAAAPLLSSTPEAGLEGGRRRQRLQISTFNVLAPIYKRLLGGVREGDDVSLWEGRARDTCAFIRASQEMAASDIVCLQEVWSASEYQELLRRELGSTYDFIYHQRPGPKSDGLLVLLRKGTSFRLQRAQGRTLCSLGSRVCLLLHLDLLLPPTTSDSGDGSSTGGGGGSSRLSLVLVNTHLSFPNSAFDRFSQRTQVAQLAKAMDDFVTEQQLLGGQQPLMVALAGDFNLETSDEICQPLYKCGLRPCFQQAGSSRWVSHRTHRGEEVAVDHVWLREGWGGTLRQQQQQQAAATAVTSVSGGGAATRGMTSRRKGTSSSTTTTEGGRPEEGEGLMLEVVDAFVSPRHIPHDTWPPSSKEGEGEEGQEEQAPLPCFFDISDHRPVSAVIEYSTPLPPPTSSSSGGEEGEGGSIRPPPPQQQWQVVPSSSPSPRCVVG